MPSFKEYTMMFQLSAATSAQFSSAFSGAQSQISQLQSRIDALNKQQGDITAYTRQQQAIEKTKGKLEMYRQQYENLRQAQEKAGGSDVDLQNKMLAKQMQIDKTSASLDQQEAKLDKMGAALEEAGVDTQNLTNESQRLDAELSTLRGEQDAVAESAQQSSQGFAASAEAMQQMLVAAGVVDLLKNIGSALKECADASIQYESAMAGVRRTVGGNDAFISGLGEDFKYLSTVIPITSTELAGIATTAGQLGIAQSNVEQFTTVMAKLATTTDLTADDAATMLAQFANITGTTDYERLGSTVASLGDATATTASKVVQMSQGMAASASQAGMSETDILGISAAVGSLGIEAQAGSTAMSTLISTLYKSVETGDKLEQFASVAGMTAEQFKTAWAQDAAGAMNSFIMGLNDVERNGKSAVVILDELGINNVRQTKAILGLASAEGLLSSTIQQANQAWQDNTALDEKASIMYETTEAKLNMMQNAFSNIKIAIGDALTPVMGNLAEMATTVMQPISEFLAAHPGVVRALTAAVGVIATVTGGLMALSVAMKVVGAASAIMTAAIPGLPLILGITAGVAGLVGVVAALAPELMNATESFEDLDAEFDDSMEQIKKQQEIIDLCDQYRDLQDELGTTRSAIKDIQKAGSVELKLTAEVASQLTSDDFVDNTYVELTPEQASYLAAADFIPDGTLITLTAQSGNTLAAAGFLDNQKVWLTAEAANELLAKGYLDKDTLDLYAQQGNYIEGQGFISDAEIELTPEAAAYLAGTDFLEGSAVQLTPEAAAFLEANGFLTGTEVELSPEAAAYLAAEGFLTGTDVELTPEAAEKLAAAGFLDGTEVVLCGEADPDSIMSPEDFVDGTIIMIEPDMDVDALNEKLTTLKEDISSVGSDLSNAKQTLSDMQSDAETLNNKMLATNEKAEKAAYAEQLEALNGQIEDQKTVVDQLTDTYDSLNAEYETTQATVDAVTAKQAQLAGVKEQLIASSGGLITATDAETEAFNSQVDALEALAEMKQSEIREQAYSNIVAQSKAYAEAAQNISTYQQELDAAKESQSQTIGAMNGGVDELQGRLDSAYETLSSMLGGDSDISWNSSEVQAYVKEVENLLYLMTGSKYDFSGSGMAGLSYEVENAQGSYEAMQTAWAAANAEVEKYANAVLDAEGTQQDFLDNLVAGVRDGGMSLEYLEGLLNEQFANTEGGADLVADAMAYVREQIEGAADAADDLGDGLDGTTASALDVQTAVQPIIDKMAELKQAYDDAYESAKSSLDGQFELFEKVGEIKMSDQWVNASDSNKGKSDQSMREAMESQAKYFEEYNSLLQTAQQKGVDTDLLATLADGSMESAETLKRIASESTTEADIQAMNAAYELVNEQKSKLAETMADIQTDFSDTMSDLQSQMTETIGEMEMSAEAAAAAQSTFEAMASEADAMLPTVRAAYQRIAAAANAALAKIHAPKVTVPGGVAQEAYAEGTDYAAPGVALVGEHGPELVMMAGGEQVFTAAETAAILSKASQPAEALPVVSAQSMGSDGSSYVVTLSPVYNISGNANAADIEAILKAHDAELIETVKSELADMDVDKARRSYT